MGPQRVPRWCVVVVVGTLASWGMNGGQSRRSRGFFHRRLSRAGLSHSCKLVSFGERVEGELRPVDRCLFTASSSLRISCLDMAGILWRRGG